MIRTIFDLYNAIAGQPDQETQVIRPTPPVAHSGDVDVSRAARLSFGVRRAAEPEIPTIDLAQEGTPPAPATSSAPVIELLTPGAVELLAVELPLSDQMEEGGFLAGQVYRQADAPERHVVVVQHVLPAEPEHTGASLTHFTFTGDSFRAMTRTLNQTHPEAQLVGWYHTHLFPASRRMGLSAADVELHQETFRRPWQIAALINISGDRRTLRCYAASADGGEMTACPLSSSDEAPTAR